MNPVFYSLVFEKKRYFTMATNAISLYNIIVGTLSKTVLKKWHTELLRGFMLKKIKERRINTKALAIKEGLRLDALLLETIKKEYNNGYVDEQMLITLDNGGLALIIVEKD